MLWLLHCSSPVYWSRSLQTVNHHCCSTTNMLQVLSLPCKSWQLRTPWMMMPSLHLGCIMKRQQVGAMNNSYRSFVEAPIKCGVPRISLLLSQVCCKPMTKTTVHISVYSVAFSYFFQWSFSVFACLRQTHIQHFAWHCRSGN